MEQILECLLAGQEGTTARLEAKIELTMLVDGCNESQSRKDGSPDGCQSRDDGGQCRKD
jgi:hypothetical protein